MTITRPVYATREALRQVIDIKTTARNAAALDRGLEAGSEAIEGCLHRRFYPEIATRYFDWPDSSYPRAWRIWLEEDELVSLTSILSGSSTILPASVFLYPNQGPPYTRLELDRASNAAFAGATSPQRGVAVTGLFGYRDDSAPAGTVAEALDTSETEVQLTSSEAVGVGDLLKVDSERMLVTERTWLTTGLTVQGSGLAAGATGVALTASGTGVVAGETILVDSERMLVVDAVGTAVTVQRAYDGSVLGAHLVGATIYAPRSLTVTRGVLGTTAATHLINATCTVHVPPALIRELCIGEALNYLVSANAAWARVIGAAEYAKEYTGVGLDGLRKQARKSHGRYGRTAAV